MKSLLMLLAAFSATTGWAALSYTIEEVDNLESIVGAEALMTDSGEINAKKITFSNKKEIVLIEKNDGVELLREYALKKRDGNYDLRASKLDVKLKYDNYFSGFKFNDKIKGKFEAENFSSGLFMVTFKTHLLKEYEQTLTELNAKNIRYIPHQTIIVDLSAADITKVESLPFVERIEHFEPAYKLSAEILEKMSLGLVKDKKLYNLVALKKNLKPELLQEVIARGGVIINAERGNILLTAELDETQLIQMAMSRQTLWIEEYSAPEEDMWKAHIQGGSAEIGRSIPGGLTGKGMKGHILEGVYPEHPDLAETEHRKKPIAVGDGEGQGHGHATFGQIFGSGAGNKEARGLLPDGQGYYTNYNYVIDQKPKGPRSRYELNKQLMEEFEISFQTASWGYARTTVYDARSAEMDHIVFHLDMPITQSQSNSGTRQSRPQAWAKNIISIGGVKNGNTADPSDDHWSRGASIGPAEDGRIKPDLVAYYDNIITTSKTGYRDFGGTSGATPIVAGFLGLSIELYAKGLLGDAVTLEHEATMENIFKNRPHAVTSKALLINSAVQYNFEGAGHDLTRVHQGWGFPSIGRLYKNRNKTLIDNEDTVLQDGEFKEYSIEVADGEPLLKATMVYREPEAAVNSAKQLLNDLNLTLTSPSGQVYFGNYGLLTNMWSQAGGEADDINNVENVFVKLPEAGVWTIRVEARELNVDAHLGTVEEKDAAYGLVVSGGVAL